MRTAPIAAIACVTLASCGVAVAVGAGKSTLVTDRSNAGDVSATFTYRHAVKNEVTPYSAAHLKITRAGRTLLDAPVRTRLCGNLCWPAGRHAVRVVDVEGDGEPDVLLNLYSGGAHCCELTQVFRYNRGAEDYATTTRIWGDPGYTLNRLGGGPGLEFVSADDRFAYAFAAYAFSGLPVQILRFHGGTFIDVTREHPAQVRSDGAYWWKSYRAGRHGRFCLGYLAAWAADEYNLGERGTVARTLAQLDALRELRSSPGFGPGGQGFISHLQHFLGKDGYTS